MQPLRYLALVTMALALPLGSAKAVMTFGGTTNTNITDPGNGVPWVNVAEIENGTGGTTGSGVYLGNQFVLTANHVGPVSQIVIGGSTFFVDTSFSGTYSGGSFSGGFSQVGNTDMKLVRLTQNPVTQGVTGLQTINLNTSTTRDLTSGTNYIIGYGQGKGTAITGTGTGGWTWAANSEGVERWGTNTISGVYTATNGSWVTNTLVTTFDSLSGSNEAAVELDDSGGALFYKFGSSWFLSGITLYVTTNGASYYAGDPATGGATQNYFGRIADYQSLINAGIAIPEPSSVGLMILGGGALVAAGLRRARKR